jgi:hypothetical protein
MLQLADAHFFADRFGPILDATSAVSEHPSSGMREEPDEIAESFPSMSHTQGQQPCQWTAREFAEVLPLMEAQPTVMASGGGAGVTIEFPYGRQTSLCRMVGTEPHPRLGNGLFMLQSFPVEHLGLSDDALVARALQENASELSEDPKGYGFGSYCYRDGCIHWSSFIPNVAYAQGLLPNFFAASAGRAAHMAAAFATDGAQQGPVSLQAQRPPSAMERLLRFLGGKK